MDQNWTPQHRADASPPVEPKWRLLTDSDPWGEESTAPEDVDALTTQHEKGDSL